MHNKKCKGNITIEAIIIFTATIFVIAVTTYIGMLIFEQQRISNLTTAYANSVKDSWEKGGFSDEFNTNKFNQSLKQDIIKGSILRVSNLKTTFSLNRSFYSNNCKITVVSSYNNPLKLRLPFMETDVFCLNIEFNSSSTENEAILRDSAFLTELLNKYKSNVEDEK